MRAFALGLTLLLLAALPARAASPFAEWAAVVVAGDYHAAHGIEETLAFDNARRDVSLALQQIGFQPRNIRQFSVRPELYPKTGLQKSAPRAIYQALSDSAAGAAEGCLIYFTSHGTPDGVQIGDGLLPPALLGQMLDRACGQRPTIAVISACFSGVFVPELGTANRMVLTAARPDRSSFGCSAADKYPYFDDCLLQILPKAPNFAVVGPLVQACVAAREKKEGMSPPSEPQVWIGPALRPILPLLAFPRATTD